MKKLSYITFGLLFCITLILAFATFAEVNYGSQIIVKKVYTSWWMITLWVVTALLTLRLSIKKLSLRTAPIFLFHISLIIVMLGALTTFMTSKEDYLHLRGNKTESEKGLDMPFSVKLNMFKIDYYTQTQTPKNYISYLQINDKGKQQEAVVSMNNIYTYKGYRFCQMSFDQDLKGTTLKVSYDPYGIAITYNGFALIFISMIWIAISRNKYFLRSNFMITK